MRSSLRWALLFVIGAVVGTLLDRLHVAFGVLDYAGETPLIQPHWVPPLFGSATLLFVASYQRFRGGGEKGSLLRALGGIAAFAVAYFCSAYFHAHPLRLLALFALGFIPFAWGPNFRRFGIYAGLIALGGILFESAIVKLGAFGYLHPGPFPVPIWLGGLYLYAAVAARQIDLAFFNAPVALPSPATVPAQK